MVCSRGARKGEGWSAAMYVGNDWSWKNIRTSLPLGTHWRVCERASSTPPGDKTEPRWLGTSLGTSVNCTKTCLLSNLKKLKSSKAKKVDLDLSD
jgi:hypothetical protein